MAPNTTAPQVYQPATDRDPATVRLEHVVNGNRIARQLELESIGRMIAAAQDLANSSDHTDSSVIPKKHAKSSK